MDEAGFVLFSVCRLIVNTAMFSHQKAHALTSLTNLACFLMKGKCLDVVGGLVILN